MAERSFATEVQQLRSGAGTTLHVGGAARTGDQHRCEDSLAVVHLVIARVVPRE